MIKQFKGEHDFLSNFHHSPIDYEGIIYPTIEHAFQAAKTDNQEVRQAIAAKDSPAKAKRAGASSKTSIKHLGKLRKSMSCEPSLG